MPSKSSIDHFRLSAKDATTSHCSRSEGKLTHWAVRTDVVSAILKGPTKKLEVPAINQIGNALTEKVLNQGFVKLITNSVLVFRRTIIYLRMMIISIISSH